MALAKFTMQVVSILHFELVIENLVKVMLLYFIMNLIFYFEMRSNQRLLMKNERLEEELQQSRVSSPHSP